MQSINALSLAPDVCDWLASPQRPRVLHIFDRACNLINEREEVLSIVTPHIGNGPFNLVLPGLRKPFGGLFDGNESRQVSEVFSGVSLASSISSSADQLTLGELTIIIADADLWSPRPDWERLHVKRENILDQIASLRIPNYQPSPPASLLSAFSASIAAADLPASLAAARKLAGLGIGLTPAGDDFMLGAVLAAWIIHPLEMAGALARAITDTAAPLTTSLSAAWLRSAGRGEAGASWRTFFAALISSNSVRIRDALAGFSCVCMAWMDYQGKELATNEDSSRGRHVRTVP